MHRNYYFQMRAQERTLSGLMLTVSEAEGESNCPLRIYPKAFDNFIKESKK